MIQVLKRGFSTSAKKPLNEFVIKCMAENGLNKYSKEVIEQLKASHIVDKRLLFSMSESDLYRAGLKVGSVYAINQGIENQKKNEITMKLCNSKRSNSSKKNMKL